MDLRELIPEADLQQDIVPENPKRSKEEYATYKKEQREALWERVEQKTVEVFQNGEALKDFLSFIAHCTPQTTANLLALYGQDPQITQPRTFEKWKEIGCSVRGKAKGFDFFVTRKYTRADGSAGESREVVKAFDISQTTGPRQAAPPRYTASELLPLAIRASSVRLCVSDGLPAKVQAQYVPDRKTIYVRNGMDETTTLMAIVREQAQALFSRNQNATRKAYAAQSYCAAYVFAAHFGLPTDGFRFDGVCQNAASSNAKALRKFITDVRNAAYAAEKTIEEVLPQREMAEGKSAKVPVADKAAEAAR